MAETNASTTSSQTDDREVITCGNCQMVQFRTLSGKCRRCKTPYPEKQKTENAAAVVQNSTPAKEQTAGDLGQHWKIGSPKYYAYLLAKNFAYARTNLNISQGALSNSTDIARAQISRLESGNTQPTIPTLLKLTRGLGVNLNDFLSESFDQIPQEALQLIQELRTFAVSASLGKLQETMELCKQLSPENFKPLWPEALSVFPKFRFPDQSSIRPLGYIAENARYIRQSRGLSQDHVEIMTGLSSSCISQFENKAKLMLPSSFHSLARALSVRMAAIIGDRIDHFLAAAGPVFVKLQSSQRFQILKTLV